MRNTDVPIRAKDKRTTRDFRLFRYFVLVSLAAVAAILLVSTVGLRWILLDLVLGEAETDAVRVSRGLRDCELHEYIPMDTSGEQVLSIAPERMGDLDRQMRLFLAPFDIVKIKIYNAESRIVYSTDPKIIGRLDRDNALLAKALSGATASKRESKDSVWDLADEERANVEIVETYVPMCSPSGKIIGSFEVYKDVTPDLAKADAALVRVSVTLSVIVVSVFGVLQSIRLQQVAS